MQRDKFDISIEELQSLNKGDTIWKEQVEKIVQLKSTEQIYRLQVLSFREFLENFFWVAKGLEITIYEDPDGNLNILEDAEAYPILQHRMNLAIRRFKRNASRFYGLEKKKLTFSQGRKWEQDTMFIAAMNSAVNEVELKYRTSRTRRDDLGNDDESEDGDSNA